MFCVHNIAFNTGNCSMTSFTFVFRRQWPPSSCCTLPYIMILWCVKCICCTHVKCSFSSRLRRSTHSFSIKRRKFAKFFTFAVKRQLNNSIWSAFAWNSQHSGLGFPSDVTSSVPSLQSRRPSQTSDLSTHCPLKHVCWSGAHVA